MKYYYGEYDGEEFPTQENLFGFDQLMDFILEYGDQAMKALEQMMKNPKNAEQSELLEQMLKEGMLDKDGKGKLKLTPRSIGKMQRKALMEVFANMRNGQRDGHEKITAGVNGERIDGTKPYQFGDPVSELDLHQTMHNALARHGLPKGIQPTEPSGSGRRFFIRSRRHQQPIRSAGSKSSSTRRTSNFTSTKAPPAVPPSFCWT